MPWRLYLTLCKPRIGLMIMLTAVVAYLAVTPHVSGPQLAALALAMLLGSASSSVFNHFWDRDIDRLMDRTKNRPLANGALVETPERALWFAAGLLVAGVGLAALALNWVAAGHLFLGIFFYGIVYTVWLKRRTWWNIVIGGAAGSFAVLAGAAAADPSAWLLPWLMATTLFLWTPSHFWALAILLKDDYAQAKVPMLPCLVGNARCSRAIMVNSLLLVVSVFVPAALGELGLLYTLVAGGFSARFLWQSWRLCKDPSRDQARRVFLGSMVFLSGLFLAVLVDRHLPGLLNGLM
ncbi:MAG: heme o synthase [Rhodospirillum sp.]|nr:heme o synthase [Rhodospirillum sp.]MCF8489371.1 heme o synthase [Rhodospirillum sp.]MCF8501729.1 heme o synthase [Rhodospirillum sp.]